jgi:hypothetical protein
VTEIPATMILCCMLYVISLLGEKAGDGTGTAVRLVRDH